MGVPSHLSAHLKLIRVNAYRTFCERRERLVSQGVVFHEPFVFLSERDIETRRSPRTETDEGGVNVFLPRQHSEKSTVLLAQTYLPETSPPSICLTPVPDLPIFHLHPCENGVLTIHLESKLTVASVGLGALFDLYGMFVMMTSPKVPDNLYSVTFCHKGSLWVLYVMLLSNRGNKRPCVLRQEGDGAQTSRL